MGVRGSASCTTSKPYNWASESKEKTRDKLKTQGKRAPSAERETRYKTTREDFEIQSIMTTPRADNTLVFQAGKVAVITGAASGIGLGVAKAS